MDQPIILREGIIRHNDSTTIEVHLSIDGVAGWVGFNESSYFHALHGPWASHTGFRSLLSQEENEDISEWSDDHLYERAIELASHRFTEDSTFAFLVGDENRDCGWRKVSKTTDGRVRIRLPQWHKGILAQCLETFGVKLECSANEYWAFEHGITKDEARSILRPALSPGTRFSDEATLARMIDDSVVAHGFVRGEPLSSGQIQGSLF